MKCLKFKLEMTVNKEVKLIKTNLGDFCTNYHCGQTSNSIMKIISLF